MGREDGGESTFLPSPAGRATLAGSGWSVFQLRMAGAIAVAFCIALAFGVAVGYERYRERKEADSAAKARVSRASAGRRERIRKRYHPDGGVLAAKDLPAFAEWIKYSAAGDRQGLDELLDSERCFWLEPTATLRRLQTGPLCKEVRVLSGRHKGKIAWIPAQAEFDGLVFSGSLQPLSLTQAGVAEVNRAWEERDDSLMEDYVNKGRAFLVASGTRIQVLKTAYDKVRLRVTDGPKAGVEAWCFETQVQGGALR